MVESVRGNLDTRLRKLDEGQYDAILLAAAGLKRLGWGDRIAEILLARTDVSRGGPGRAGDRNARRLRAAVAMLDHADTHTAVIAERGVLGALGGGCQVPIGAYATVSERTRHICSAIVAAPDGSEVVRAESEGPAAEAAANRSPRRRRPPRNAEPARSWRPSTHEGDCVGRRASACQYRCPIFARFLCVSASLR